MGYRELINYLDVELGQNWAELAGGVPVPGEKVPGTAAQGKNESRVVGPWAVIQGHLHPAHQ